MAEVPETVLTSLLPVVNFLTELIPLIRPCCQYIVHFGKQAGYIIQVEPQCKGALFRICNNSIRKLNKPIPCLVQILF